MQVNENTDCPPLLFRLRWLPSFGSQEQRSPAGPTAGSSHGQPPAVQEERVRPQDAAPPDEAAAGTNHRIFLLHFSLNVPFLPFLFHHFLFLHAFLYLLLLFFHLHLILLLPWVLISSSPLLRSASEPGGLAAPAEESRAGDQRQVGRGHARRCG